MSHFTSSQRDITTERPAVRRHLSWPQTLRGADITSLDGHLGPSVPNPPAASTRAISSAMLRRRLFLADMSAIGVGVVIAFLIEERLAGGAVDGLGPQVLLVAATLPAWVVAWRASRLDRARHNQRVVDEVRNIVVASLIVVVAILGLAFLLGFEGPSRLWVGSVQVAVVWMLLLERRAARAWFTRLRRDNRVTRRTLIVGTDECAVRLKQRLDQEPALGYEVVGFVQAGDEPADARRAAGNRGKVHDMLSVLGSLEEIETIAAIRHCTGVMISLQSVPEHDVNVLTRRLTDHGLHVALSTSLIDIDVNRLRVHELDHRAMIYVEPTIRTGWRRVAKRAFDVSVASIVMVLSAPVMGLAVVAIVGESGRPFLFRQTRVGMGGDHFQMLKLRTMVRDAEARRGELLDRNEADGPLFKIEDDPRVTRVGRFLRKASIDELPQLWNVMRGDMSLVGPRPALPDEVAQWSPDLHERLRVLPGITGLWQVSGRSSSSFDDYKRLDLYYVDNWSLRHDASIVWRTVGAVLRHRGAN